MGGRSCVEFLSLYGWAARVTKEIERSGDARWEAWPGKVLCDSRTCHEQMFPSTGRSGPGSAGACLGYLAPLSPTKYNTTPCRNAPTRVTLDPAKYLAKLYNLLLFVLKLLTKPKRAISPTRQLWHALTCYLLAAITLQWQTTNVLPVRLGSPYSILPASSGHCAVEDSISRR